MKTHKIRLFSSLLFILLLITGCSSAKQNMPVEPTPQTQYQEVTTPVETPAQPQSESAYNPEQTYDVLNQSDSNGTSFNYNDVPPYTDSAYVDVNNGEPYFTPEDMTTQYFENYSPLDELGRCQTAFACLGRETLPTEKRTSISHVKPTGWHTVKYPEYIAEKYLYNRCHLIAHELSAENDNKLNLITGTRYMNVTGMLPFEDNTTYYIKSTNNHVMYRVTPVFVNDELVCRGVLMEAKSVEDNGAGIKFCVFCYNVQPFITIDYQTGESHVTDSAPNPTDTPDIEVTDDDIVVIDNNNTYVLNTNSKKIHTPECALAKKIAEHNKEISSETINQLINEGYTPCKNCNPQ